MKSHPPSHIHTPLYVVWSLYPSSFIQQLVYIFSGVAQEEEPSDDLDGEAMDPEALPATGHASLTRARHEVQRKRSVEPAPPSSKPRGSRWEAPKTGAQEQGGGGLTFPISFAERVARMSGQQGAKPGGTAEQAVFGGGSGNNKKVAVASKWND